MISLAKLSIRHSKATLAVWLSVAAVLTLIGLGVSKSLSPTITVVPGTEAARAQRLAGAQFGPTELVPILLAGPRAQLDRQGPKLVALLAKRSDTRVLSAQSGVLGRITRSGDDPELIVTQLERELRALGRPQRQSRHVRSSPLLA